MNGFLQLFNTAVNQNTLGAIILAAFVTLLGILARGMIANHGTISVAKLNSETTLGTKAIETLTTALEVLQEENRAMKQSVKELEKEIEELIEHILCLVKAPNDREMERCRYKLEQYLRRQGRWPQD